MLLAVVCDDVIPFALCHGGGRLESVDASVPRVLAVLGRLDVVVFQVDKDGHGWRVVKRRGVGGTFRGMLVCNVFDAGSRDTTEGGRGRGASRENGKGEEKTKRYNSRG